MNLYLLFRSLGVYYNLVPTESFIYTGRHRKAVGVQSLKTVVKVGNDS